MNTLTEAEQNYFKRLNWGVAGVVLVGALLVLMGWQFHIPTLKRVLPQWPAMKANTAAALMLLAVSMMIAVPVEKNRELRLWLSRSCALPCLLLGALTLAEYLFDTDFSIDLLLFPDPEAMAGRFPPGRMAPITAVNFVLLSLSLLLGGAKSRGVQLFSQIATLVAFVCSFQALVAFAVGLHYTFGLAYYTQIAFPAAVLFVLMSVGIFLSRPDQGLMILLRAPTLGGRTARRLISSAILVPPMVSAVLLLGQNAGLYDADFASLLRVMGNVIFFSLIVWQNSVALHEADLANSQNTEELKEREKRLREAVSAREEFLSIASHELRTPLTPLRLQAQMLIEIISHAKRQGTEQAAKIPWNMLTDSGQSINRQATRITKLVDQLLDTSRIQAGKLDLNPEIFDLVELARETGANFTEELKTLGCRFELSSPSSAPGRWDRLRIEQVLVNLIHNAMKYSPGKPIQVTIQAEKSQVKVTVKDEGIGISTESQKRIFERFERAVSHRNYGGLGLGLYIASQIIKAHGGSIQVESELGSGASFTLCLPWETPQEVHASSASPFVAASR